MENDFYHSDFEELIREKADQYKMYPSDRVWKGIDRTLRSRRKWYWSGFVLLLSGVSYFAVTHLMAPAVSNPLTKIQTPEQKQVSTDELIPFSTSLSNDDTDKVTTELLVEDSGDITAAFQIPLRYLPGNESASPLQKASFQITGLEPLAGHETYNIELSWPVIDKIPDVARQVRPEDRAKAIERFLQQQDAEIAESFSSLDKRIALNASQKTKRISWQLAFSPTVNYRKLTGSSYSRTLAPLPSVPLATRVEGDVNKLVNHKPALGFELGTHGLMRLNNRLTLKAGIQFNYSKYDIRAFRTPTELATIALNSQLGTTGGAIVNYTDLRNFGGSAVQDLKNQYYQLSMPIGFEVRVFGNDRLQFNLASTIQPTYLMNRNTYLISTDLKNYTKAPSLVRRWNVNTGAEAYVSYTRGDVKWQVGPQFRYQLLSSYQKVYPIKEYLMEYGIKVGITKTIR